MSRNENIWDTIQNASVRYYYDKLTNESREYIRNLPEQLVMEFEGITIRAVHGSPYCISQLMYFNSPCMDRVFNELQEDVLVYGHNHELANFEKKNNKCVVQAGVIGMHNNRINKPQYTILTCNNKKVKVEPRTVEYDIEKLKKMIYKTDILEKSNTWENLCYYTIAKGKDIRTYFRNDAQEQMIKKYEGHCCPKSIEKNFVGIDDDIYIETSKKYEKYFLL